MGKWFPAFKTLPWVHVLSDARIHPGCTVVRPENVGSRVAEVPDGFQSDPSARQILSGTFGIR